MAVTALIKFTQGSNTDTAGRAVKGDMTSGAVTVSNGSDVGVVSWKFELLYSPPGSSIATVVQGPNSTPTFTFAQPDVAGSYRVRLTVADANGNTDIDIRNFCVPFPNGIIAPPFQGYPSSLPLTGAGSKPNEMNLGGQIFGWDGDADVSRKLLYQTLKTVDGLMGGTGIDHNTLANLTVGDVHTQYVKLAGRAGGQTLIGGTAASNNLVLQSTSNATRGVVQLADTLDLNTHPISNITYSDYIPSTPPSFQEGRVYYNSVDKALSVMLAGGNVDQQLGQEALVRCVNKTGVTITDGSAVYVSGAQGNRPTISLASSATESTASEILGIATEDIANNGEGFVTVLGVVHGYNTNSFAAGDILYLSATTPGQLQNTIPAAPALGIKVAVALNSTNNGSIFVFPQAPKTKAGDGLTKVANSLSVVAANSTISVSPSGVSVGTIGPTNVSPGTGYQAFVTNNTTASSWKTLTLDVSGPLSATNSGNVVQGTTLSIANISETLLAVGAANTVLWSNGAANSWTGSPTLSTSLAIGATPATTGALRLSNNIGIYARNAANSANIAVVDLDSSDQVRIGDASNTVIVNGSIAYIAIAGTTRYTFASGGLILNTVSLLFDPAVSSPTIKQNDVTTASATGQQLTVQAQNATGATSTGGSLALKSGTGTSPGSVFVWTGATPVADFGNGYVNLYASAAGSSSGNWILRGLVGNSAMSAIYASIAPASTTNANYVVGADGASVWLNAPSGSINLATATVNRLALSSTAATVSVPNVTFAASVSNPLIYQADVTTASATAQTTTIRAQNATGTTSVGGDLILAGGTGTAAHGKVLLRAGGANIVQVTSGSTTFYSSSSPCAVFSFATQTFYASGAAAAYISSASANFTLQLGQTGGTAGTNGGAITITNGATVVGSIQPRAGYLSSAYLTLYAAGNAVAPTASNFTLLADGGNTILNGPGTYSAMAAQGSDGVRCYSTYIYIDRALFTFNSAQTSPTIKQADNTTNSATGQTLTVSAQTCTGSASVGGDLVLAAGAGNANAGVLYLKSGATTGIAVTPFGNVYLYLPNMSYDAAVSSPTIGQSGTSTASATGQALTIAAQSATGTTSTGGALNLASGAGTSNQGNLNLSAGATLMASLNKTGFTLSYSAVPSANPAAQKGYLFVADDGSLNYRGPNGTITELAAA